MASNLQKQDFVNELTQEVRKADNAFNGIAALARRFQNLDLAEAGTLTDEDCAVYGTTAADVLALMEQLMTLQPIIDAAQPYFHRVMK